MGSRQKLQVVHHDTQCDSCGTYGAKPCADGDTLCDECDMVYADED